MRVGRSIGEWFERLLHAKIELGQWNPRVRCREVQRRRNGPVMQDERALDDAGDAEGGGGAQDGADITRVRHLIQQHHYLGYSRPVGEHLKYLVRASGRPIASATSYSTAS